MPSIAENVAAVRARIEAAAGGRRVLLVAASKMNDAARVREAVAAGVDACGENRVQELLEKNAAHAYDGAPLHFIGHLQKNKVKYLVGTADLIESVDSPEGDEVPNYRTQEVLTADQVRELTLAAYPGADLSGDPAGWFGQASRNEGGGVISIPLGGVTLTGGQARALFSLRSACFTVSWDGEAFTFDVTGYGHGVGMSQYGANAMAREGSGFRDILTWYYTGAQVGPLW